MRQDLACSPSALIARGSHDDYAGPFRSIERNRQCILRPAVVAQNGETEIDQGRAGCDSIVDRARQISYARLCRIFIGKQRNMHEIVVRAPARDRGVRSCAKKPKDESAVSARAVWTNRARSATEIDWFSRQYVGQRRRIVRAIDYSDPRRGKLIAGVKSGAVFLSIQIGRGAAAEAACFRRDCWVSMKERRRTQRKTRLGMSNRELHGNTPQCRITERLCWLPPSQCQ